MTGRQLPGLCDPRDAVAVFPPDRRPRWLSPGSILRRRVCVVALSAAAGFALAWIIK